jgi:putative redox protein
MVEVAVRYLGDLRCQATHGPSATHLVTDAPRDNHGRGESFSPTDLVATALATCMVTTMGIFAARHQIDISGATARVTKEMASQPIRRIGCLTVTIALPREYSEEQRKILEGAALNCPVQKSLDPAVRLPVTFTYGTAAAKE